MLLCRLRDPVSGMTHFWGVVFSIVGLILLLNKALVNGSPWHIVAFSVFGASLILLYSASTIYHWLNISEKVTKVLRRVDHMMIFVLIAGTYTPICLIPLRGPWGWSLFGCIWGLAVAGIILKMFCSNVPRWISTGIYILAGWLVVIAFVPMARNIPLSGLVWLTIGGVVYTVGAVIYGLKRPRFNCRYFGFHELFHLFVLGGSFCHFWLMYQYIAYL